MSKWSITKSVFLPALLRKLTFRSPSIDRQGAPLPYSEGWEKNNITFSGRNNFTELWGRWQSAMTYPEGFGTYSTLLEQQYEIGEIHCTLVDLSFITPTASPNKNASFNQLVQYLSHGAMTIYTDKHVGICEPISIVGNKPQYFIDDGNQRYHAAREAKIDYLYAVTWGIKNDTSTR